MNIHLLHPKRGKITYRNHHVAGEDTYLISIETDRKGPIYTTVTEAVFHQNERSRDSINIRYEIIYGSFDSPPEGSIYCGLPQCRNTVSRLNILPLLLQLIQLPDYMDCKGALSYISIGDIEISTRGKSIYLHAEDDISTIRKKCHRLGISTNLGFLTNGSPIVFYKDGTWELVKMDSLNGIHKCKYILFPLKFMESGYLLTWKEYLMLSHIRYVYARLQKNDPIYNVADMGGITSDFYTTRGLSGVLELMLFFPQIVLIEEVIYQSSPEYQLTLCVEANDVLYENKLIVDRRDLMGVSGKQASLFYAIKHFVEFLSHMI